MKNELTQLEIDSIIAEEDALIDFQFAIITAMKNQGISQAQLADLAGVSRARVSQLLSSNANPTLKIVGRFLTILDLKLDFISVDAKSKQVEFLPKVESQITNPYVAMATTQRNINDIWKKVQNSPANDIPYGDLKVA